MTDWNNVIVLKRRRTGKKLLIAPGHWWYLFKILREKTQRMESIRAATRLTLLLFKK